MAETIGMRGISVEDPSEVPEAIQATFAHEGAVLIDRGQSAGAFDAAQDPTRSGQGFTLYMLKVVLSGKGDEILDLAMTNLWR
jgi:pyruvate dehydrogenase (quinone)